ncbi:NAD(P)H dehydrogenase subunit CRR3 [Carex littledalei]|uniref:NAD(P)H dehydrogenase subunit CRR3 n=1 Tax=Carex littledalei TaxID=544730 RepID=A0A833W3E7_9POAL|nr:NAD(P)H dehydrogenase subunit CRR3 [Carex littledalei]
MAFTISQLIKPRSTTIITASSAKPKPIRMVPFQSNKSQPSISDIERAIGIQPDANVKSPSDLNSSFMDLIESSPIGREGSTERAIREVAEKFTDHAEAHTASVHRFVLELFMKILPLWLLVLAVASGFIKLPFNVPFIDDLIM